MQRDQLYSRGQVAKLMDMSEAEMMTHERGLIVQKIERDHGGLPRDLIDRWRKIGFMTPTDHARAGGRMDYTPLPQSQDFKGITGR